MRNPDIMDKLETNPVASLDVLEKMKVCYESPSWASLCRFIALTLLENSESSEGFEPTDARTVFRDGPRISVIHPFLRSSVVSSINC